MKKKNRLSFDELVKTILTNNNDAIKYRKKMYCFICKKFSDVDKEKRNHLLTEERKKFALNEHVVLAAKGKTQS
jgi:hypothetical protein